MELLQYFMDSQEPKIDQVEVVLDLKGCFRLLDENQNVIDNHYLAGFVDGLLPGAVDVDDLLISALVTLAPSHVRCHTRRRRRYWRPYRLYLRIASAFVGAVAYA